jgi:hypothetical protein
MDARSLAMRLALLLLVACARAEHEGEWRTISVYTGVSAAQQASKGNRNSSKAGMDADVPGQWHSQAGQDQTIAALFEGVRDGFFVDLAANHPLFISNTRALERDYGWRGLCIDGAEHLVIDLAQRRRCTVVNAVLSHHEGEVITYRTYLTSGWETGLSGMVGANLDNKADSGGGGLFSWLWSSKSKVLTEDRPRVTTTLASLLQQHRAPLTIEYLSLDVEGAEMMVLGNFRFDRYTFKAMTLERPTAELQALLKGNGYSYVRHLDLMGHSLDQLWVHASMLARTAPVFRLNCKRNSCVRNATLAGAP